MKTRTLDMMAPGDRAAIAGFDPKTPPRLRDRLCALGFVPASTVDVLRRAPLGDPTEYEVRGTRISLRRTEAVWLFLVDE